MNVIGFSNVALISLISGKKEVLLLVGSFISYGILDADFATVSCQGIFRCITA